MKLPLVDHDDNRVIFAGPGTGYRMIPEFRLRALQPQGAAVQSRHADVVHKRCSQCLLKID